MSRQASLLIIWAVCSFVAAALALQLTQAAYTDGIWVPVGNDSFYHARRILDAANSPRGFYQFDDMMHVPEGSWVNWPWAYDLLMAKALQAMQWVSPQIDAMYFLTHVAVYWIFVNAALLLGICIALSLPTYLCGLVMLGFAVSALTSSLHGVGIIDHHYFEYSFVLLTVLTGLRWLNSPERAGRAVALGIVLGVAPAFHTGLFILQLPVLLALSILWLRNLYPPQRSVIALACTLMLTTLFACLPSEAFLDGQFQFAILSWFHLYIAAVSALVLLSLRRFPFSMKVLLGLAALGIALLIPIWDDTLGGAAFLSNDIVKLENITETRTPWAMAFGSPGIDDTLGYYSLLLFGAPLLLLIYLWRGATNTNPQTIFFACMTVFGLTLFLTQFRLHYFGNFALVLGWALLLIERFPALRQASIKTVGAGLAFVALAHQPAFAHIHFKNWALGWDPGYADIYPLFAKLETACAQNPGIVLTDNNMGHPARYHSDCSVIANNFLMTPLHEAKIAEMQRYMDMSAEELLAQQPKGLRYVLVRLRSFVVANEDGSADWANTETIQRYNDRLYFELNTRKDLPARYRTIAALPLDDERGFSRARLLEILPAEPAQAQ